jgi:hypothetical protein
MSVVRCVFCETVVDTDYHEICTSCERCPFGENLICAHCAHFKEEPNDRLWSGDGSCMNLSSDRVNISEDDDACPHYEDSDYTRSD